MKGIWPKSHLSNLKSSHFWLQPTVVIMELAEREYAFEFIRISGANCLLLIRDNIVFFVNYAFIIDLIH